MTNEAPLVTNKDVASSTCLLCLMGWIGPRPGSGPHHKYMMRLLFKTFNNELTMNLLAAHICHYPTQSPKRE